MRHFINFCATLTVATSLIRIPTSLAAPCDEPRFAATRGLASAAVPNASATGDFNGDGKPDLAFGNLNTGLANFGIVSVLLGSGFATFEPHVDYQTVGYPSAVFVADIGHNTNLDLLVAGLATSTTGVLLGNGDGTFQSNTNLEIGGYAVAVGNFNGDNFPDVASASPPFVTTRLGSSNLTFHTENFYIVSFSASPSSLAIGDMNGDGTNDVVVGTTAISPSRGSIGVLLGNGNGTFAEVTNSVASVNNSDIVLGDFDGDNKNDVAALDYDAGTVMILLGLGNGLVQSNATYATGIHPVSIAVADFDSDLNPDLAIVNNGSHTVSVFRGSSNGTFQVTHYNVGVSPTSVTVGDFTADGMLDLVVTQLGNGESIEYWMLVGKGDGAFEAAAPYPSGSGPAGTQAGDFNGDGFLDLIVANTFSTNVSLFLNNGDGTFQTKVDYPVGNNPQSVAIADYDNDGTNDITVANQLTGNISLLLGKGDGTFFNTTSAGSITFGSTFVLAGLFNGDADMDVIAVGGLGFSVYMGNGNGTFQSPVETVGNYALNKLAAGYFNNDSNLDFVAGKTGTNSVAVLLGNGNGTFQSPVSYPAGTNVQSVAVADFNGDTILDIVAANYGCNQCAGVPDLAYRGSISVLLGNGNGTFQSAVQYRVNLKGTMVDVATGDFNGDGEVDVAITDTTLQLVSVLLGNGDGTFQSPVGFGVQNTPISLVVADLDGDNRPDMAVANQAVNNVSVLINTCLFDVVGPPTNTANLAISKLDSPDPVIVDSNLTYTIVVTNFGVATATSVTVTDALPSSVTFISASAGCTNIGSNVICDLGSVPNHTGVSKTIVVSPSIIGIITNTAVVTSATDDPSAFNNTASAISTVTLIQTDLAVNKTDSPDPVTAGSNLTYTVTVTNKGPTAATSVTLTDTLPSSVAFVSASPGCTNNGGTVTCDLGDLGNGATTSINIVVTPSTTGSITNIVTVAADEADPVTGDNTATAITTVQQPGGGGGNLTGTLSKVKDKCKTKNNVTTCKLGAGLALLNSGIAIAPATHVRFFLSDDTSFDGGDVQLGEATTKTIKPGKSGKAKLKAVTGASSASKYILAVDDNNAVLASLQVPVPQ